MTSVVIRGTSVRTVNATGVVLDCYLLRIATSYSGSTLVVFISWALRRRGKTAVAYAASLVVAFLFFCAVLKWQLWHTRLHLPLFVLGAAPVGILFGQARSNALVYAIVFGLFLQALPFVFSNQIRPLVFGGASNILSQEWSALYFSDGRHKQDAYQAMTSLVKAQECLHVGLDITLFNFDYPLLALLNMDQGKRSVIYVGVQNLSARYKEVDKDVEPYAVICLYCAKAKEKWKTYAASVGPGTIVGDHVVFHAPREVFHRE